MFQRPICLYSNLVESLYEEFRDRLFQESNSFFTEKIVIVPSLAMKRWLSLRLARDPKAGAAFNIKFLYLSNSVPIKMPSKLELALSIKTKILNYQTSGKWPDLYEYLKLHKGTKKLVALCFETASLFLQYAQTSEKMIDDWILDPSSWQAFIWKEIFGDKNPYKILVEQMDEELVDRQLHLFCLSFIPKMHLYYFSKRKYPVFIYALSPTAHFWTDLRSRSEASWILNFFKEKKVKQEEQEELLTYLLNTNSLLADFGRVGRKFFSLLEEFNFEVIEKYSISNQLIQYYDSLIINDLFEDVRASDTLLDAFKTDLLLMKSKDDKVVIPFNEGDDSIQVHASCSRLREIEVLYNNLLQIMTEKGIHEEEVLVMAPNIAFYAPFIEAVFASKDSLLDYQILDLKISSQNPLAKGFELFLELIDSRFSYKELMKLFSNESFQKKQGFDEKELQDIEKFIDLASITWGQDEEHRKRTLNKIYGDTPFDCAATKTWKEGLNFIIKNMVVIDEAGLALEMSQSELLGRLIELIYSLMEDIAVLEDRQKRSLKDWAEILTQIVDKFFEGNKDDVYQYIFSISRLKIEESFSFDVLLYYLKERLSEESAICFDNKVSAVRFCSLLPMRAIPAKVVCLLGLDESSFPRRQQKNPLDERAQRKDCDYLPTSGEYDRYLFLEALLSARETLILSYCKNDKSESLNPSELVKEIVSYALDVHGVQIDINNHPLDPFNCKYFDKRVYQERYYELAKVALDINHDPLSYPIDNFSIKESINTYHPIISIKQLNELIRKPLKFYVEKVLGLKLTLEEKKEDIEPLLLNPLHFYQIKRGALRHSLSYILDVIEKRKILPTGLFGSLAKRKIIEEVESIQKNIKQFSIDSGMIKSLFFEEGCKKHSSFDKIDVVPKITIELDQGPVSIIGKIEDVTPFGLLTHRKNTFEDLIKELPKILIHQHFYKDTKTSEVLLYTEGKKMSLANTEGMLKKLLSYYSFCHIHPSPLTPKSVKGILDGDLKLKEDDYDPYLSLIDIEKTKIDNKWQDVALNLFDDVYRQWYGK
jgi:exodeoxyribonuclease V gamma subunit